MFIKETHVNRSKNYWVDEPSFTEVSEETIGGIFRSCQKYFGRCIGKIYIDTKTGTKSLGWVFLRKEKYDDCKERYLHETWVELHEKEPTKEITEYPVYI